MRRKDIHYIVTITDQGYQEAGTALRDDRELANDKVGVSHVVMYTLHICIQSNNERSRFFFFVLGKKQYFFYPDRDSPDPAKKKGQNPKNGSYFFPLNV